MKLALSRDDLVRALGGLNRVVEKRNTIPILSHIHLRAGPDGLHLTATDLDLQARIRVDAEVEQEGALTLPAGVVADYAKRLPDKSRVSLDATGGTGSAVLRAGRSRCTLGTLSPGDFPDLEAGDHEWSWSLPGQDLTRLLAQVEFAISTEETRYYLNGIFLHALVFDGSVRLRAVATDGHRLGLAEIACPAGAESLSGIIVPRKAVAELKRIGEAAGAEPVGFRASRAKIRVEGAGWTLVSKLIDGTFPDYQRVIPTGNDKIATFDTKALARAIERVATVATERGRAVRLDLADGNLTLAVKDPNAGSALEELDCSYDAPAMGVGLNGRYAGDILSALASDTVELALADPGAPMIWRTPTDPSRLYVLMPMRV